MDFEEVYEGFSGAVAGGIPVFADFGELETERGTWMGGGGDGDFFVEGEEAGFADAFWAGYVVDLQSLAPGVSCHVFFPAHTATVGAEGLGSIGGEMTNAEIVIRHGEHAWCELFVVGLAGAGDVAGTPAAVNELPLAVINLHGVPGVIGVFGW